MRAQADLGGFDEDEILSMGQSSLVMLWGRDCDESIFLSGPSRLSEDWTSLRALALYAVAHNELGLDFPWPGHAWVSTTQFAARPRVCLRCGFDERKPHNSIPSCAEAQP